MTDDEVKRKLESRWWEKSPWPAKRLFNPEPPSDIIALKLTARSALVCEHRENPCLLHCGVERPPFTTIWRAMSLTTRLEWLEDGP